VDRHATHHEAGHSTDGIDVGPGRYVQRSSALGILENKVVAITGAGRGLGRAFALVCATEGARVVVNDISSPPEAGGDRAADVVVEAIRSRGGTAVPLYSDISKWAGGKEVVDCAIDTFGALDGLVNNAGNIYTGEIADITEEELDMTFAVHVKGTLATAVAACRYWRDRAREGKVNRASIVNTVSDAMFFALQRNSIYAGAKAEAAMFTRIGSIEGAEYGVRMNAYGPRAYTQMAVAANAMSEIDTAPPVIEAGEPGDDSALSPMNPTALVAWLLSDRSAHVTGQIFRTLGGGIALATPWTMGEFIWPGGGAHRFTPEKVGPVIDANIFHVAVPTWERDYAPGDPRHGR
jgi:NAD(P)-dependent dehydrogenase (short-subunit alcohol dehydrogenase family)